jgi:hypothetical protein
MERPCIYNEPEKAMEHYRQEGRDCRLETAEYHPEKMTVEEFYEIIIDNKDAFVANMNGIKEEGGKKDWAENWMDRLTKWSEMEHEIK